MNEATAISKPSPVTCVYGSSHVVIVQALEGRVVPPHRVGRGSGGGPTGGRGDAGEGERSLAPVSGVRWTDHAGGRGRRHGRRGRRPRREDQGRSRYRVAESGGRGCGSRSGGGSGRDWGRFGIRKRRR
ncbi:unnamed protein product, partial [Pylaiella littoralis]